MLFYIALFAGAMTIGSCSQDEMLTAIEEKPDVTQPLTSFVSGDPETTRTTAHYNSTDGNYPFYWTLGDHIWVYKNAAGDVGSVGYNKFNHSHSGSTFSEHEPEVGSAGGWKKGHFSVHGLFKGDTYNVYYVGQASPSIPANASTDDYSADGPLQVTVKDNQTQIAAYNADHFATSGDCGYAVAEKKGTGYQFKMNHLAAYLLIYPWHDIKYSDNTPAHLILDKITIDEVSPGGPYAIAGTHEITNGRTVLQPPLQETKKYSITLDCGPEKQGFVIPYNALDYTKNGCFVVMSPSRAGDAVTTRQLKMTFDYYDVFHRHFTYVYEMQTPQNFYGNSFRRFYPKITGLNIDITPEYPRSSYYCWDGEYPHTGQLSGNSLNNTPWSDSELVEGQYSCKNAPDVNELYWYWKNGDIRWDNTTQYKCWTRIWDTVEKEWVDTQVTITGGVWIKRRDAILRDGANNSWSADRYCGHPSHGDAKIAFCLEHGYQNEDMRYWEPEVGNHGQFSTPDSYGQGKPADDIIDDYFFLPALGHIHGSFKVDGLGTEGRYWLRSICNPHGNTHSTNAWYLQFNSTSFFLTSQNGERGNGYVGGDGWFH